MKHADRHELFHTLCSIPEGRAFSLVASLEPVVFRGQNVPGPHFGRESVDSGEDWRDVCTQRGGFMVFDIAGWHVTCISMRENWSYQSAIHCVLLNCIGILIMLYGTTLYVVVSLQASIRCPKSCMAPFIFNHAIQKYWCPESPAVRLPTSSWARHFWWSANAAQVYKVKCKVFSSIGFFLTARPISGRPTLLWLQKSKIFSICCSTGEFLLDFIEVIITANLFLGSFTDC
jgi:hypothetical protein